MITRSAPGPEFAVFLEELARLREVAGLSAGQLAGLLGAKESAIHRGETGSRRVGVAELQLWAFACGTTLEAFAWRLDERMRNNQLPGLFHPDDAIGKNGQSARQRPVTQSAAGSPSGCTCAALRSKDVAGRA